MSYAAVLDRRMPLDNDGTVGAYGTIGAGITAYLSGAQMIQQQGYLYTGPIGSVVQWLWFPEQRETTGVYTYGYSTSGTGAPQPANKVEGSTDTTNGLDGTWETASMAGGYPAWINNYSWRDSIKPVSFTGPKATVRVSQAATFGAAGYYLMHIYGAKGSGQTADDILFLDGLASYAEFASVEDFGNVPLGTTWTRTFKIKNASATKTANSINIQCNDADFAISTDNVTWVTTINISSLAAGASSATMYVRNTTPGVGNLLGPRFARIVATVGSWT